MDSVSQNTDQKATPKRHKIHRSHPEVSRKIIAFETISEANQGKSAREISKLINIPNSTMQSWKENLSVDEAMEDEVSAFFRRPAGASVLHRITVSIMYNNKCGLSGILGAQQCLRNAGLSKYVASSTGALQKFWERCEDCILTFGKEWEQKLAKGMKERKITVLMDEMFRKGMPCLVAIEAVSNYILLEKFTENRTSETWKKELDLAIKDLPVTIVQIGSDLCGAIRSVAKSYNAAHSPDLFHGQYEISKAVAGALVSQERSAEKALKKAEEDLTKMTNNLIRIGIEEKAKQKEQLKEANKEKETLKAEYEAKKTRREKTQDAKRRLGKIYHPIDLDTGKLETAESIEEKFAQEFEIIGKNAEEAGLSQSCHDRIGKAERAFALMIKFLKQFFLIFGAILREMKLTPEQEKFFKEVIFPLSYFNKIWKSLPKEEKDRMRETLQILQKKEKDGAFTKECKEDLIRRGKELAETFQRSTSSVEGRNGGLSLLIHRFHHFHEKTLKVLTIVHNFGIKRKSDDSTAAERFFGSKHDDLFDYLERKVRIPSKPQLQLRRQSRWVA
jgi:uncharacterized protein with PIN domain